MAVNSLTLFPWKGLDSPDAGLAWDVLTNRSQGEWYLTAFRSSSKEDLQFPTWYLTDLGCNIVCVHQRVV